MGVRMDMDRMAARFLAKYGKRTQFYISDAADALGITYEQGIELFGYMVEGGE